MSTAGAEDRKMMASPVDYRKDGLLVTLSLNQPQKRNGLSPEMVDALLESLGRLRNEPDVRCAILTGVGTVFSAGGDPRRMLAPGLYPDMSTAQIRQFYKEGIQRLPLAFHALEIPVVAAINGPAIGAGCDLACLCDLRVAATNASFAASFVKLGLVPGDGGAWLLPRIVGSANASEMLLTGDPVDAQTALRIGLVSAVTAPEELLAAALDRARRIAANPPHAVQLTKRLLAESQTLTLAAALEMSASMQAVCHRMEDHREAVSAVIEKRTPQFRGK
jgi:enoyl-CoA hydratase/carnithine racemase